MVSHPKNDKSLPDTATTPSAEADARDKSPDRIAAMFDRVAPRYDFLNHFLSAGIDRRWRRRLVRTLRGRIASGEILDVATGTADLAICLAKERYRHADSPDSRCRGSFPYTVTGIDFSEEMLKIGEEKVRRAHLTDRIALLKGDALNLPFEDNRFAASVVAFGIRNMADTDRALSEMIRVTSAGGMVMILEFSMPTLPGVAGLYRFYFRSILPKIGRFFSKGNGASYAYLPASVQAFDTPREMTARMTRLGLSEVSARRLTLGIASLYQGRKPRER